MKLTNRDFVLRAVKRMPANASFQKILLDLDELLLAETIRARLNNKSPGREIPAEEVPKLIKGWIREARPKKKPRK